MRMLPDEVAGRRVHRHDLLPHQRDDLILTVHVDQHWR
jgi:hypothetical protein